MRIALLSGLAVSTLLLAACTGDEEEKRPSRAEIVQQADAICRQASSEIQDFVSSAAPPTTDETTIAALQQDVDSAEAAVKKLRALGAPEEQQADLLRFTQGLRDFAASNRTFITAINNRDPKGVGVGSDGAAKATAQAERAAKAYGLSDCPAPTTATAFADTDQPGVDPIGLWTGTVTQLNANGTRAKYQAIMNVKDVSEVGKVAGTIRYPSYPCGGKIIYLRNDGDRFYFRERITERPDKCPSGGRIRATVSGDQMAWRWTQGSIKVAGILKRR